MKKQVAILAILFSFISLSIIVADVNIKDRVGEIKLRQDSSGGTRSESATAVSASICGEVITVETENYAGNTILVEIFDAHGILQPTSHIDYTYHVVVDISFLPPGQYEIVVTLDYRYRGGFVR